MSTCFRVALTGGIGSGKSTVALKFQELGVPVIDSDVISRDIVKPDKPFLKKILNEFGNDLLSSDGSLDRKKLRTIIFNDDIARKKLDNILHPAIYQEIDDQIKELTYPYCLVVVPLLLETNAFDHFDRVLLVEVSEDIQIERAKKRDNTSAENIKKIIKSQIAHEKRLKYADDIINNNLKIEELNESIQKLHDKYIKLSS